MRYLIVLAGLAGCTNPFGDCAGALLGTYEGPEAGGTVTANLSDDGDLELTLVDADGNLVTTASVPVDEESGEISTPDGELVQIDGTMDLSSCIATGDWASMEGSGTWEIGQ